MDAARPGLGGKHMPDYLRLLTLAKDERDVWKGKTNTAIRGSLNGSTGSTMIAQCLAAANTSPHFTQNPQLATHLALEIFQIMISSARKLRRCRSLSRSCLNPNFRF